MASTSGRRVIVPLVNRSGAPVAAGDVVAIGDGTNDACFTTTAAASFNARHIGIAQETIASLATGRVLTSGYAAIVNSAASLTRNHFLFTSTVAKEATGSATRAAGAFGQVLTTGLDTVCLIWGVPDATAGAGGGGFTQLQEVKLTSGNLSTVSTSFVDATGLTITLTTAAVRCIVKVMVSVSSSTGGNVGLDIAVDGVRQGQAYGLAIVSPETGAVSPITLDLVTGVLSAASHTIKVQWRTDGGTGTMQATPTITPAVLQVLETTLAT